MFRVWGLGLSLIGIRVVPNRFRVIPNRGWGVGAPVHDGREDEVERLGAWHLHRVRAVGALEPRVDEEGAGGGVEARHELHVLDVAPPALRLGVQRPASSIQGISLGFRPSIQTLICVVIFVARF